MHLGEGSGWEHRELRGTRAWEHSVLEGNDLRNSSVRALFLVLFFLLFFSVSVVERGCPEAEAVDSRAAVRTIRTIRWCRRLRPIRQSGEGEAEVACGALRDGEGARGDGDGDARVRERGGDGSGDEERARGGVGDGEVERARLGDAEGERRVEAVEAVRELEGRAQARPEAVKERGDAAVAHLRERSEHGGQHGRERDGGVARGAEEERARVRVRARAERVHPRVERGRRVDAAPREEVQRLADERVQRHGRVVRHAPRVAAALAPRPRQRPARRHVAQRAVHQRVQQLRHRQHRLPRPRPPHRRHRRAHRPVPGALPQCSRHSNHPFRDGNSPWSTC